MSGELPRLSDRETIVTTDRTSTFPFQNDWQTLVEYMEELGAIVADGDKGDIIVSGGGSSWTIDPSASPTLAGLTLSAAAPTLIVKDNDSTGTSIAFTLSIRGSDDVGVYSIARVGGAATVFYGNTGAHVFNVSGSARLTVSGTGADVVGALTATGAASFASLALTADLPISEGGTGASTAAGARTNLGVTATGADTAYAFRANNLSDLASAVTARDNLDLGTADSPAFAGVTVTGDATLGDAETDTVTVAGMLRLTSDEPASITSTQHPLQIGPTAADNLVFGDDNIQARNNGVAETLSLNRSGGRVELAQGTVVFDSTIGHTIDGNLTFGSSVLFSNVTEATLSSTAHALQIGTTAGTNLAFDSTEIQARNNGAASTLELNPHGGSVSLGGAATLTSATLSALFTSNFTSAASTRETLAKFTVSDAGNDAFYINNLTATDSRFQPAFTGLVDSADNLSSMTFSGHIMAPRDVAGDGGVGVVRFRASRISSATDPVGGTNSAITTRTLFSFDNASTIILNMAPGVVNMGSGVVLQANGTQVLTSRRTGWTADTGTAKRTANATYAGTAEAAYTQATIQALMDAVRDATRTIKALKDDLITHGAIGA